MRWNRGSIALPCLVQTLRIVPSVVSDIARNTTAIRGRSRWHLLFKAASPQALFGVHRALARVAHRPPGGASVRFDMDPYAML